MLNFTQFPLYWAEWATNLINPPLSHFSVQTWFPWEDLQGWRAAHIYRYLPVTVRSVSYNQGCHKEVSHTNRHVHICGSWPDLSHSITFPLDIRCPDSKFSPRDQGDSSSPFLGESHKSSQEITGKTESALVSRAESRLFWFVFISLLLILLPKWLFLVSSAASFIWILPHHTLNSVNIWGRSGTFSSN